MALFSNDTKKTKKAAPKKAAKVSGPRGAVRGVLASDDARIADVLKRPWFSEKALLATEKNVYVFEVSPRATKHDIMNAINTVYKVLPTKVHIVNLPAKKVSMRTRRGEGSRARRHKAYVYLAAGDTIQFA